MLFSGHFASGNFLRIFFVPKVYMGVVTRHQFFVSQAIWRREYAGTTDNDVPHPVSPFLCLLFFHHKAADRVASAKRTDKALIACVQVTSMMVEGNNGARACGVAILFKNCWGFTLNRFAA